MPKNKALPNVMTASPIGIQHDDDDMKGVSPKNSQKDSGQDIPQDAKHKNGVPSRSVEHYPPGKLYCTSINEVPVTSERKPYFPKPKEELQDAGTARATVAASIESPNGTMEGNWAAKHQHQTVLQQHITYWDQDGDGVIWPQDTYTGVRNWGWSPPLALLVTFIIHFNLSYPTVPGWFPDPFFRVYVKNVHKDKHGSDSMTFDNEGRFRPQHFEDLFAKYDEGDKGGLDVWDLVKVVRGQRFVMDVFGVLAAIFEWTATYLLLWPEDGVMRKEDIRRVFDGSIFQKKADDYAKKQAKARRTR